MNPRNPKSKAPKSKSPLSSSAEACLLSAEEAREELLIIRNLLSERSVKRRKGRLLEQPPLGLSLTRLTSVCDVTQDCQVVDRMKSEDQLCLQLRYDSKSMIV